VPHAAARFLLNTWAKGETLSGTKILGLVLLIAGLLGLAYGGFSYTRHRDAVKVGPVELQVNEKEHVNIPLWAGVGVAVLGGILLARRD
jgi:hypothetical protein